MPRLTNSWWKKENIIPHLIIMGCVTGMCALCVFCVWRPEFKPRITEYHLVLCQVGDDQLTLLAADGWVVDHVGAATATGIPVVLRRTK